MAGLQNSSGVLVIVGFAEALSAPEVVWSLADSGAAIMAFARKGARHALACSKYVSVFDITPPEKNCAQSIADLTQQISSLKQSNPGKTIICMPLDDAAVWLVNRAATNACVIIAGPTGAAAALALDKSAQIACARDAGFSVPKTRLVENVEEVFGSPLEFPLVFKPVKAESERDGKLGRGRAWTCADLEELKKAVESWGGREPMLLQNYVPGVGEGLFGLAGESGVIGWSAHRRVRMMNPQGSGSSACASKEVDAELRAAGERFISISNWRGLFMIELLRDDAGRVWFMELNGRAWGSMALARRMGLEYPAWALSLAMNPTAKINIPAVAERSLVCRHLGRELVHLLFVMRGPRSKALTRWPSRWSAVRQFLSFTRNDRWYNWRRDDRNVFFNDAIQTLKNQLFKVKCSP